ncbi:MAG: FtsQ-type POTRA domain-containing protein [Rhodospirillaceae bacterium]|nr:FtsQ-type POTRA domain-containing protein [Rhodospirillaceae bacterium]
MMKFWKKQTETKRGQPRKRVVPLWRQKWSIATAAALMVSSLFGAGWWMTGNGWMGQLVKQARWSLISASGELGFTVEDVLVVGRSQTTRADLLKAVRLARGAPILAYDLEAARQRVEVLPWVRAASVERMLPDTILLSVVERQPLALWQVNGQFSLIDRDGVVILKDDLERFSDLLVVVGNDAPKHAAGLLDILQTQPQLMNLVKSAVRVSGRRWDVQLKGGIDIRLPESGTGAAWLRLAEYESRHGLFSRDVRLLDLRLPDRLIVKKGTDASGKTLAPETEI